MSLVTQESKILMLNSCFRKIFHLSVILVYLPGLKYDPILLYYCSIAATLVFISLELLRWSEKLPLLTNGLSAYLKHFTDEKEGGYLILKLIFFFFLLYFLFISIVFCFFPFSFFLFVNLLSLFQSSFLSFSNILSHS